MSKDIKKIINSCFKKNNFGSIIDFISRNYPNKIFIVFEKKKITFKNFNIKINQTCNYLKSLNLKKGDVLSLYLQNSIEFIILYFACIRGGLIVSPIPYGVSDKQISYYLELSKSKIIISDKNISKIKRRNIIIGNYNDFLNKISSFGNSFFPPKILGKNVCVYYFSSGTTANPKLIKYSNQAMISCQKILFKSNFLKPFSIHMCILPLGHTASLRYTIKNAIIGVGKIYLYKNFWSIKKTFWKKIIKNKINFIGVVPTILKTIYTLYKKRKNRIDSLNFFGCGSSILSEDLHRKFEKKFKSVIRNIYGMSEIGVATIDDTKKHNSYGTIGKPLKGVKVKLISFNDKFINKDNIKGEICVKTPSIFSGYKGIKKNFSKANFKNGYFKTGDLAIYKNSNLKFVDRSKDIIIKGGVNIAPQEIDECLQKNDNVLQSATIAINDEFYGENIKSFVILKKNKNIEELSLINYCIKNLGKMRSPSKIEFVKDLPKTSSGKILKRLLKN